MELRHLRYFVALADCLSFTRAAQRVHVTQSTLSHQIRQLEEQLGQPLFARNGPRLKLTDRGREYYTVVQQGLGVIKRGTERLFRHDSPALTISTTPSVITSWLVPRVGDFERRYPGTSLHLSTSPAMDMSSGDHRIDTRGAGA